MTGERTVSVHVAAWILGDHGDPPVIGRVEQYPLIFLERTDGPGVQTWDVVADLPGGGVPDPGPSGDGERVEDQYDVLLRGPGWAAHWRTRHPVPPGPIRVRGALVMHWPGRTLAEAVVRGRIERLRVVTATRPVSPPDPHEPARVPGAERTREIESCVDVFALEPDEMPGHERAVVAGLLVDLDPDRTGPVLPGAVAAYGDDLWVADRDLPRAVRIRGARGPRPEATTVAWELPRPEPAMGRQLHADASGCWLTDSTGTRRLDADGGVRLLDRFAPRPAGWGGPGELPAAANGDVLAAVVHDPDHQQPAVLRLYAPSGLLSGVVLPARYVHAVVAHDDGFLVLLGRQSHGHGGPGGMRLAAVDLDGRLATGAMLEVRQVSACPLSGSEPTFVHGNRGTGDADLFHRVRSDGVSLDAGVGLDGWVDGAWSVAGRVVVTGPDPAPGTPAGGEPLDDRPTYRVVELDPDSLEPRRGAVTPRVRHAPAVDGNGDVWISADGVRRITDHGTVSVPLDLESLVPTVAPPRSPVDRSPRHLAVERTHGRSDELPVPVAWQATLGRGPGLVVALAGALVHRTGVELTVTIRSHQRRGGLITGGPPVPGPGQAPLLLGVEFADGRVATTYGPLSGARVPEREDELVLHPRGGGGNDRHVNAVYVLSPLPPAGPLVVHCLWPEHDVPETRTALDTAPVLEAAARVEVLWTAEPPDAPALPCPPPRATRQPGWPFPRPDVPAGGWFDRHLGRTRRGAD